MVQILRLRAKYVLGFAVVAGLTVAAFPLISRAKAKFSHTSTASTVPLSSHRKLSATPLLLADDSAPGSHANYNDYSAAANVNGYGHGATLVGTGYASLKDTAGTSGLTGSEAGNADHTLNGSLSTNGTITVGASGQVYAALSHGDASGHAGGSSIGSAGAGSASSAVDVTDSDLANSDNTSQGLDTATAGMAADGVYGDPTAAANSGSQQISSVSDRQLQSFGGGAATVITDDSTNVIVTNTRGTGSTPDSEGAGRNAGEFTSYGADDATNGSASGGGLLNSGSGSGTLTSAAGTDAPGGQLATIAGTSIGSGGGLLAINTGGSQGSGGASGSSDDGNGGTINGGFSGAGSTPGARPGSGDKQQPVGGDLYNGATGQPTSSPSGDPLGATAAPEPGVVVTALSLIGMTGIGLIRGRRRAKNA